MARQSKSNKGSTRVYAPTHYTPLAEEPSKKAQKKKAAGKDGSGSGKRKSAPKKDAKKAKRTGKVNRGSAPPNANTKAANQETIMVPIELLGAWGSKVVGDEDKPKEPEKKKRSKKKATPKTIFNEPVAEKPEHKGDREPHSAKRTLSVLIALVILGGLLAMGYFLFLVEEITVTGNEKYSSELIKELSGLEIGGHILLSDIEKAAAAIESTAYIKVLGIKREFPRTISIRVAERKEAAVIPGQSYDVIIDIEGHVLSIGASSDTQGLLRVIGMSQHGFSVNQPVGTAGDVQAATLKLIMQNLSALEMLDEVAELNLSNPLSVNLKTTSGVDVLLGQADDLEEKLMWMKDTLPSLNAANVRGGTLDVGAKGGPIYSPPGAKEKHTITEPQSGETETDDPETDDPENENSQLEGEEKEEETGTEQ